MGGNEGTYTCRLPVHNRQPTLLLTSRRHALHPRPTRRAGVGSVAPVGCRCAVTTASGRGRRMRHVTAASLYGSTCLSLARLHPI